MSVLPGQTKLNRQAFLKIGGLLSATSLLAACRSPEATPAGSQSPAALKHSTPAVAPTEAAFPSAAPTEAAAPQEEPTPIVQAAAPAALKTIVFQRLAFGPRPGDLEAFDALPGATEAEQFAAYVEQQLSPDSIDDTEFDQRYQAAGFETLEKSAAVLWDEHIVHNPFADDDERHWWWYELPVRELVQATVLRAAYSRKQLVEVLADFWHNHFNVYGWHEAVAPLFVSYDRDVIRANLLGNFRQMLEAMARHPSMLYYLDNYLSTDAGPNENFARELFELHTLGAENYLGVQPPQAVPGFAEENSSGYVDNDVYEAARCFTGWRVDDDVYEYEDEVGMSGEFLYLRGAHDRFNKLVLGRYIPADQPDLKDGLDVLDLLAQHPGTARHICRKLCRRLVSDEPPEDLVQAAAQVFWEQRAAPDQLRQVVQFILFSDAFRLTWGSKFKRPQEAAYSMLRALEVDFTRPSGGFTWLLEMMGQPIFGRRPPDGYPDLETAWANTMSLLYRWNLAVGLVENWLNDDGETPMQVDLFSGLPADERSPAGLVDFWSWRLLGRTLGEAERGVLIEFLAQGAAWDDWLPDDHLYAWLPGLVELILMSADFQLR